MAHDGGLSLDLSGRCVGVGDGLIGLEGIVSKRAMSLYRGGPSKNWLKTKNMVESDFILIGTERRLGRRALGAVGIRSGWPA